MSDERLLIIAGMLPWPLGDRLHVMRHIQAYSQEGVMIRNAGMTVYLSSHEAEMAAILACRFLTYTSYDDLCAEWRPL